MQLCSTCSRQIKSDQASSQPENISEWQKCSLCFGIMNADFINEICTEAGRLVQFEDYDTRKFVLVLNFPVSLILRDEILRFRDELKEFSGVLRSVPLRIRLTDAFLKPLTVATKLRATKNSDFTINVNLTQSEFTEHDWKFLQDSLEIPEKVSRKRKFNKEVESGSESQFTKSKLMSLLPKISTEIAQRFVFTAPESKCSYSIELSREPLFIGSRYCKYSRNLPQSAWSPEDSSISIVGTSVSEIICEFLKQKFNADLCRFTASGREDVDVRMLGSGRPFSVRIINARKLVQCNGTEFWETCQQQFNSNCVDVRLNYLRQTSKTEADILKKGEEEKRKTYTALCISKNGTSDNQLKKLKCIKPIEIIQKTPVRVLRRRPLLSRKRNIFDMAAIKINDRKFLLRLTTQAGTYVKEFVNGEFGRTSPSLSELMKTSDDDIDILELDVEKVDLEWPPGVKVDEFQQDDQLQIMNGIKP